MTDAERHNLEIITVVCDAFNEHDPYSIMRRFADRAVWPASRGEAPVQRRTPPRARPVAGWPFVMPIRSETPGS